MFFPIRYLLPTDVNVGLRRLWTQVQNLTKLWILCFDSRIPKNNFLRCSGRMRGVRTQLMAAREAYWLELQPS
jgi:hypothetical protein